MVTMEKLGESRTSKKLGNHRVEVCGKIRKYFYYNTEIAREEIATDTYWVDPSYGTRSTKEACNAYREYFDSNGLVEVEVGAIVNG